MKHSCRSPTCSGVSFCTLDFQPLSLDKAAIFIVSGKSPAHTWSSSRPLTPTLLPTKMATVSTSRRKVKPPDHFRSNLPSKPLSTYRLHKDVLIQGYDFKTRKAAVFLDIIEMSTKRWTMFQI